MDPRQHHQANRAAWNEAARSYEREVEADIAFLRAGGKRLLAPELRFLHDLGVWCQRAIHLQCAGGRDTLRRCGIRVPGKSSASTSASA